MKIAELRAKNPEELKDLILSLKKEQFNLRMQKSTGALENQSRFKEVRRSIAQAKTLMNETPKAPRAAKAKKEAAPKKAPAVKTVKAKKEKE